MLRNKGYKSGLMLAVMAALGGSVLMTAAPAEAQGFSVTIGDGYPGPRYGPPPGYGPPRGYYRPAGPPPGYYGRPAYGYGGGGYYDQPRPRRCWNRPVDVWNGYGYETRLQRVCR